VIQMLVLVSSVISSTCKVFCSRKAVLSAGVASALLPASVALADWTPLLTADDFTGPQADIMTTVGGSLLITLVVMAAMLVKNMLMGGR
jgi:hypothetical protein